MKTLQKTVLWSCVCVMTLLSAKENLSLGNEVKEYDKIFDRIAERRIGADVNMIDKLDNPFIHVGSDQDANATIQTTVYNLEAILNQKAKINGNWYKRNDTVGSYKLITITYNSVILKNEIEKKELEIRTKDESNVKIFSK